MVLLWLAAVLIAHGNAAFVSTWNISNVNELLVLPISDRQLGYNISVIWGDTPVPEYFSAYPASHVYRSPGMYSVSIGNIFTFDCSLYNYSLSCLKLINITSWGLFYKNASPYPSFVNCRNLQSVVTNDLLLMATANVSLARMFLNCSSLNNITLKWDLQLVSDVSEMFSGCSAMNSPILFQNTQNIRDMSSMFQDCLLFNQSLSVFDTSNVYDMSSLFSGAKSFNQPLSSFNTQRVIRMSYMFSGAESFNRALTWNTASVTVMNDMFRNAYAMNSIVNFSSTTKVTDMNSMFKNATSFNQFLPFDTSAVQIMDNMFYQTSISDREEYRTWNASLVTSCISFCSMCALPPFISCVPCTPRFSSFEKNWSVCACNAGDSIKRGSVQCGPPIACVSPMYTGDAGNCVCAKGYKGTVRYMNNQPTGCVIDYCTQAVVGADLQVDCIVANATNSTNNGGGGGIIISPIFNITKNASDNNSVALFNFTLPVVPDAIKGILTQPCYGTKVRCEWFDPSSQLFQTSGCETFTNIDLGSGVVGAQCICTHLTVFALILRQEIHGEALCQAEVQDYILIALYSLLLCVILFQMTRLALHQSFLGPFVLHSVLLLASTLRIVYLAAKPVIRSVSGLVFLGLLPSALALTLFIHVLIAWVNVIYISKVSLTASPFAKFRKVFIVIAMCVFVVTIALTIAVSISDTDTDAILVGCYILAAMYAIVCLMVLVSGLGLHHVIAQASSSGTSSTIARSARLKVLLASLSLGVCLFCGSALWIAAIQTDILTSTASTLATSVIFYLVDWFGLCMLTFLFVGLVKNHLNSLRKQVSQTPLR